VSSLLGQLDSKDQLFDNAEREKEIMWSAVSLYTGGADTVGTSLPIVQSLTSTKTVAAIATFFLAMVLHPEIQKELQAEIDTICLTGQTRRLPTFEDRSDLPLVDACLKEILRWKPVLPLGRRNNHAGSC
jgi:hypothetical protein